jgi:hypothetical protein
MASIAQALSELGITEWVLCGEPTTEAEFAEMFRKVIGADDNGSAIESSDPADFGVTWAEVSAKMTELQAEYDAQAYARSRAAEYPSVNDYLDGIVKGDQAQIDAYIAACQAVKAKYPKPE